MKGRFRKGKKAFRGTSGSSRQRRFESRYQAWLLRREQGKKISVRLVMAGISAALGAMRSATIQSQMISAESKAIAHANNAIETANAVTKALNFEL